MDLYIYLAIIFVVISFVILLPILSGIGTFQLNNPKLLSKEKNIVRSNESFLKFKLKENKDSTPQANVDSASSAFKKNGNFEIDSRTGIKRRTIGKYNNDPNSFDYEIEDLINEDIVEEENEQKIRLREFDGNREKAYEEFV